LNRKERRERKEDSESLSSLCSLQFAIIESRGLNHRERRDHKVDLDSESLSSLCSLRFFIFEFRGLNRRERRERKEDLDSAIWQQVVAKSADRKFSRKLRENRLLASEHFCDSLSQYSDTY
jgi:hypothetical protein